LKDKDKLILAIHDGVEMHTCSDKLISHRFLYPSTAALDFNSNIFTVTDRLLSPEMLSRGR